MFFCRSCQWWKPRDEHVGGICTLISGGDEEDNEKPYGALRCDKAFAASAGFDTEGTYGVLYTEPDFGCNQWSTKPPPE